MSWRCVLGHDLVIVGATEVDYGIRNRMTIVREHCCRCAHRRRTYIGGPYTLPYVVEDTRPAYGAY
jgi:hypothetical protein